MRLPRAALAVRLCGTESNRWAIGGQIQVHAGGVVQTQLISNGSDLHDPANPTRVISALANESAADSIVVHMAKRFSGDHGTM